MGKERKIVGLWPAGGGDEPIAADALDSPADAQGEAAAAVDGTEPEAMIEAPVQPSDWAEDFEAPVRQPWPWAALIIAALSLTWIGFIGWVATNGGTQIPAVGQIPALALQISAPIGLLLLVLLLAGRISSGSLARHAQMVGQIHDGHARMRASLAETNHGWRNAQAALESQSAAVTSALVDAAMRIEAITQSLDLRMRDVVHNGKVVAEECDGAHRAMLGVVQAMPKAEEVARRAAENMRVAGQAAYQFGGQLEARLAAIQSESAAAEKALTQADETLAARVEALIAATGAAEAGAARAGDRFATILADQRDSALAALADLAAGMETSIASAEMRLETARSVMREATEAQLSALESGVTHSAEQSARLAGELIRATEASGQLDTALVTLVASCASRIEALEEDVETRLKLLGDSFAGLHGHAENLSQTLEESSSKAADLGDRSAKLMDGLRVVAEHVSQDVPHVLDDVATRLTAVQQSVDALKSTLHGEAATAANGIVQSLHQSDDMIAAQATAMRAMGEMGNVAQSALAEQMTALESALDRIGRRITDLQEAVGPQLAGSLASSEATAQDTAARIRQSMSGIVESSSDELGRALDASLQQVVSDKIVEQLNQIAVTADGAVTAANTASDRLMRQLITIAETTRSLEAQANDLDAAVATDGRQMMARRMALVTEALQSTAVDITRLLSVDVADQSWAAYLKGDRGIFARRAVRLLSSAEAREILKRYQEDEEFRSHVNLYIHEFEDMLRGVMETRDGDALSVTLLSSDVGKIYVALAQSIERLRG